MHAVFVPDGPLVSFHSWFEAALAFGGVLSRGAFVAQDLVLGHRGLIGQWLKTPGTMGVVAVLTMHLLGVALTGWWHSTQLLIHNLPEHFRLEWWPSFSPTSSSALEASKLFSHGAYLVPGETSHGVWRMGCMYSAGAGYSCQQSAVWTCSVPQLPRS